MNISFERRKCQELCEKEARKQQGLPPSSFDFSFKGFCIDSTNVTTLVSANYEDSVGAYYNALISFLEGCLDFAKKRYSWAAIKLYYSVFYGMKAKMGFKRYAMIRQKGLYIVLLVPGEKAKQKEGNDHYVVTQFYKKCFPSDFLLSNTIMGEDFLTWMTNLREITNYKEICFKEPHCLSIFESLTNDLKQGKNLANVLDDYRNDFNLFCFQEESAYMAMPLYLLLDISNLYKVQSLRMTTNQRRCVMKYLQEMRLEHMGVELLG